MAIKKKKRSSNGVETEYHRVAMYKVENGQRVTLLVHSYLNEEGRQWEKDYASEKFTGEDLAWPYKEGVYHQADFDESMTLEKAYRYLKTLPEFEGSEDC